MYACYKGDIDKLTQDDMWAIQYLYLATTVKPTVSKVWQSVPEVGVKDTVGNSSSTHEPLVNLCDFNKEIDTFLIANHHMYIFYKKYVLVSQFLPDDFKEISHIYQRPSGDVLIVVKNVYYLIDFPSFNVKRGYNLLKILNTKRKKN
jgi:hypothetical protein